MVEFNYTTILSPAYVYIYIYICMYVYIYIYIYGCLYLYNIYIYITYTIQLYSWFYTHFPASDFFSFSVFRAWNSGHSWSQVQPRGCSEGFLKGAGLKEGSLRMAHFCGGFTMIYRAFWLLKMVMFHIFSRAIGSSKIRESPIENEDNI